MRKGTYTKYPKEILISIVASSTSYSEVIRKLGLKGGGGTQRYLKFIIGYHAISTSHFTGQGWSKGQKANSNDSIARVANSNAYLDKEVFRRASPIRHGYRVVRRLLRLGWEYKSENSGLSKWQGKDITLHLDHKNGIFNDNRLSNLRLLCPNCHQQTETWGVRKTRQLKQS